MSEREQRIQTGKTFVALVTAAHAEDPDAMAPTLAELDDVMLTHLLSFLVHYSLGAVELRAKLTGISTGEYLRRMGRELAQAGPAGD